MQKKGGLLNLKMEKNIGTNTEERYPSETIAEILIFQINQVFKPPLKAVFIIPIIITRFITIL